MSARLVPLTEGLAPAVPLLRPVLLIGRHPECDARIDLPQVSRRHCCVALADDRLVIRDLGSRHGVRVNGRLVEEARLFPGDEIAIAHVLFRLEETAPPPPPPRPAPPPPPAAAKPKPSPPKPIVSHTILDEDELIPLDDDSL